MDQMTLLYCFIGTILLFLFTILIWLTVAKFSSEPFTKKFLALHDINGIVFFRMRTYSCTKTIVTEGVLVVFIGALFYFNEPILAVLLLLLRLLLGLILLSRPRVKNSFTKDSILEVNHEGVVFWRSHPNASDVEILRINFTEIELVALRKISLGSVETFVVLQLIKPVSKRLEDQLTESSLRPNSWLGGIPIPPQFQVASTDLYELLSRRLAAKKAQNV